MTTTSSEKKKKTRELPNLTECHCCHLRVDLAKSSQNNKLQILYSEWRIVLLCNKCLARVESTELCSYCFNDSSSGHCFSCRQCRRRVHRDCDSEYRSAAVWSGSSSAAADEVSFCADCWVSESLARWRRSRNVGSGRKSRADLGFGRSRVLKYERKCDPNSTDSSTEEEAGCLRLDGVEEEEEEIGDDEPLKEGQGSCSNGVESESPPSYKQDDCNCIALPKVEIGNAKLDPYYFKYRRRSSVDQSLLTYKRRSIVDCFKIGCPLLTYRRRGSVDYRFMFTYKRRRNFDQSMLTYKRRRPEIVYASSKMQLEVTSSETQARKQGTRQISQNLTSPKPRTSYKSCTASGLSSFSARNASFMLISWSCALTASSFRHPMNIYLATSVSEESTQMLILSSKVLRSGPITCLLWKF